MSFLGAKLVLTHDDRLLTCLRDDFDWIPFPAHWDLPGGGAEDGESPIDCALRELHEEFGLTLTAERLWGRSFTSWSGGAQAGAPRVSWMFRGTLTAAEIATIRFGDEGQEWQMMPISKFTSHPRAVPHFRERVPVMLGAVATA